ncbi:NAD(P)/FAD-dependent oxidoreductase [Deefgea salmonis]|uniref:FAD-dependent oxidoreductase n=1 Tax=Deefgea salmonis TaxID=2875502 RepID=A0ABS8BHM2_9NEIS|nr:FAD-dependent oxidoreductase [Deefgea salmonis]MCB5195213.1 FAD-dependent oxidoreductase [Deefgea salmonis]
MNSARQRIAVIGSGISGLASAYFLSRAHDVVLFEAGQYLGGHTNTVDITVEGLTHPVDTGFLVFNQATYPNLIALFAELGVNTYGTDMSFGVSLDGGELEWAGTNLDTVFAQRRRLLSPSFIGMLRDIFRFNAAAHENLAACLQSQATLGQLLASGNYGETFRDAYLLPMAAAIWSSSPNDILEFPASTFLRFCLNHALLQVNDRPQWQTVQGGAREYVRKIAATLTDIRLQTPVLHVERLADGVMVHTSMGAEQFDAVVFATHAPDTLAILSDASEAETTLLSAVRYQANTAVLHTDPQQLPKLKKVWSAWNYLGGANIDGQRPVCVSYLLNQLQNLPFTTPVVVTLNPFTPPAPDTVLAQFEYQHPGFDHAAIAAQAQLQTIQGQNRTWFAGAWTGYGFHEDGLKSALRVARDFDLAPTWTSLP